MPIELQDLIESIPTAEEGRIITSKYHNSLLTAIRLIASQLGSGPVSQEAVAVYPPHFVQNGAGPNWVQTNGVATQGSDGNADGWLALQLPQGARIQKLTVTGRRVGAVASFSVKLLRVTIADGNNVSLITMLDPFTRPENVNVPGAGPKAIEEYSIVDNNTYTYLVTASLLGAQDLVQVNGIQVSYNRLQ
jgi:hypothetical protein